MVAQGLIVRQEYLPSFVASSARTTEKRQERGGGNAEKAPVQSSAKRQQKVKQIVKRVAIVDDEEDLLLVFSMLVSHLGYDIECIAHDGNEIVQALIDGKRPDVILMDYRMPRMNGLRAAELVLKRMPEMKIVIASADDSIRQATLSAGLLFIPKPFSSSSLAQVL